MRRSLLVLLTAIFPAVVGIAYAITGTLPYSVTGGGTIACDIGPSYTGSIPAGAQAAGFTHCAANYDFTFVGNFTSTANTAFNPTTNTYNWATQSTWLGACGASDTVALISNQQGYFPHATPCSDFDIESDSLASNKNVLHIKWTAADAAAGNEMSWLSFANFNNPPSAGTTFPNGLYTEILWRSNQTTQNALNDGAPQISFFSCPINGTTGVEWDTMEAYHDGGNAMTIHDPCASSTSPFQAIYWNAANPAPYVNTYHTNGTVISSNGTNTMGIAVYLDGTKISSSSFTPGSSSDFTARELYAFGIGDQNVSPPNTPSNNMDMYIQHISFWVLPGCTWQTQQCNGSIFQ